jgi:cytochrome c556
MKRIMGSAIAVGAVIVALGWGMVTVSAQEGEAVVKDRQAAMKQQGVALVGVKKFLDGSVDQAAATQSADDLVKVAQSLATMFPKATGMAEFPGKSGAKPIIWTDNDKFMQAQKDMVAQAQKLAAVVKTGDKAAIQEQWSSVSKNGCGGCHTTFREKLG